MLCKDSDSVREVVRDAELLSVPVTETLTEPLAEVLDVDRDSEVELLAVLLMPLPVTEALWVLWVLLALPVNEPPDVDDTEPVRSGDSEGDDVDVGDCDSSPDSDIQLSVMLRDSEPRVVDSVTDCPSTTTATHDKSIAAVAHVKSILRLLSLVLDNSLYVGEKQTSGEAQSLRAKQTLVDRKN